MSALFVFIVMFLYAGDVIITIKLLGGDSTYPRVVTRKQDAFNTVCNFVLMLLAAIALVADFAHSM